MEFDVIELDPTIVVVENHDSNTRHSVVPAGLHCSCEDHQYRNTYCKHLLFLAETETWIGETIHRVMQHRQEQVGADVRAVQQELDQLVSDAEQIETILNRIDENHGIGQTVTDVDDEDGLTLEADIHESVEAHDEFEQMVDDIQD